MYRVVPLSGPWRPRIHVVRHPTFMRDFYSIILSWVDEHAPELSSLFLVEDLTRWPRWDEVVMHTAWLQDPVQQWSMQAYHRAASMEVSCDLVGIPVINRVTRLLNATKFEGARIMASVGVRVARTARIASAEEFRKDLGGLRAPLFVREEWGHSRRMVRADSADEARKIDLAQFKRPLAIEVVDVRSEDGLFRKYRYFAAGDEGVSHHVQVSADWATRGEGRIDTERTRADEEAYVLAPDPNHALFQRARRALGLEFLAFDYGYDREGKMVVWEANPFPLLHFPPSRRSYRMYATHRTIQAILRMYLTAAAIPVPEVLRAEVG